MDMDAISAGIVQAYPRRRYPAVVIGSSGGALVHLCAALGVPWLPQTLLLPVRRRGISPDDPQRAAHALAGTARAMLDRNPDLVPHHMHDPNQDRLTLRRMAYFRVKRRTLGEAYERLLADHLEPGGLVVVAECGKRWPVTHLGKRHLFQFDAVGGIPPQEYRQGSDRVTDYLRRYGADRTRWVAPVADGDAPEAEWGFEPALRDDITAFADRFGFRVRRLAFPVQPSLTALEKYLGDAQPYDHIQLALFCHGVESAGVAAGQWQEVLNWARVTGTFAGVSPRRYPRDFRTFFGFQAALRRVRPRRQLPEPLPLAGFDEFLGEHGGRYPGLRAQEHLAD